MAKKKQPEVTVPQIEFPKVLYAAYEDHGTDNEYLCVGTGPRELKDQDGDGQSVKVARYVLVGVGTIQHSAPAYVEDAQA